MRLTLGVGTAASLDPAIGVRGLSVLILNLGIPQSLTPKKLGSPDHPLHRATKMLALSIATFLYLTWRIFANPASIPMILDNPAHRLWLLLYEAKKIEHTVNCKAAWARLFDVDTESPELFTRMGKVMQLPAQAVAALAIDHADELPMAKHWQIQINTAFAKQNLRESWSTFINNIDVHAINYLRTHAKLINGGKQPPALTLDTLDDARSKLAEVIETVLEDDDLDATVRLALIRNLRQLVSSLDEYKITGSSAVFDAISVLYGQGVFDQKYRAAVQPDTSVGQQIHSVVAGIADAMTIMLGFEPLSDLTKRMLALAQAAT